MKFLLPVAAGLCIIASVASTPVKAQQPMGFPMCLEGATYDAKRDVCVRGKAAKAKTKVKKAKAKKAKSAKKKG
jgi:hypothetical protein